MDPVARRTARRSTNRMWLAAVWVVAATFAAQPAAAWDSVGHQVVAAIAWERMEPATREAAVELLLAAPADSDLPGLVPGAADSPDKARELFLRVATWPDIVRDEAFPERRDRYHRSSWHYINYFWDQGGPNGTPRDRPDVAPRPTNVVERLGALRVSLADRDRPAAERGIDLAWVLHLVGDVHQPLHTSARITETEPEGDRGGNLFYLARRSNLHAYWDRILRRSPRFFWTVDRLADEIGRRHPEPPPPGFDFAAWAKEGYRTAKAVVYPPDLEREGKPSRRYHDTAYTVSTRAIARAGHRLAALLDAALGEPPAESGPSTATPVGEGRR